MQPYAKVWIGQQILKTLYTKRNIKKKKQDSFLYIFLYPEKLMKMLEMIQGLWNM